MGRAFSIGGRWSPSAGWYGGLLLLLGAMLPGASDGYAEEGAAAKQAGIDAVLIMDSSGSMAKNDPKKLRVPAAKLFMSLLGQEDRIGLISFSDNGYPVLHLTTPAPDTKDRILASADKVSSRGVYTNLHAALEKGIAMLDRESAGDRQKILVLMSDGKMDVGNDKEEQALTGKLEEDLLQQAKDKGIQVYTIAFTDASDVSLLKKIALTTSGLFKLARTDRDLHDVFSGIFETAKDPDMLPVEGGEFVVDASIEEVTIVASKEGNDIGIYLQSPSGKKYSAADAGEKLKWFPSTWFDMITVIGPEPGTWKLLKTGGRNRAYIVTNMVLNHNPQQPALRVDQDMVLEAWLEQDGELLNREAVLTNTRFVIDIRDPAGTTSRFELFDQGEYGDRKTADGVYSNTIGYTDPGSWEVSIIVEGETFRRQKTVHFEVADAADAEVLPEPPVQPPVPENVPGPAPEPEAPPAPVAEEPPGDDVAPAAPEEEAVEETAEPVEQDTEAPPAPKKKKGISMGLAIGLFVGINLLLGLIGFGTWWFMKKRRGKAQVDDEDGDDGEAAGDDEDK